MIPRLVVGTLLLAVVTIACKHIILDHTKIIRKVCKIPLILINFIYEKFAFIAKALFSKAA